MGNEDKNVFVFLFHEVLFPRKGFKTFFIGLKFIQVSPVLLNLAQIIIFIPLELAALLDEFILCKNVVFVEKQQPYQQPDHGEQVFVPDYAKKMIHPCIKVGNPVKKNVMRLGDYEKGSVNSRLPQRN